MTLKFNCMRICDVLNENQLRHIRKISKEFDMPEIWILQMLVNLGRKKAG